MSGRQGPQPAGQSQLHGRSAPDTRAPGADGAAMELYQVPCDREAKAETAVPARRTAVGLAEAVEHERQERRINADTGIAHDDDDGVAVKRRGDVDAAAGWRELD